MVLSTHLDRFFYCGLFHYFITKRHSLLVGLHAVWFLIDISCSVRCAHCGGVFWRKSHWNAHYLSTTTVQGEGKATTEYQSVKFKIDDCSWRRTECSAHCTLTRKIVINARVFSFQWRLLTIHPDNGSPNFLAPQMLENFHLALRNTDKSFLENLPQALSRACNRFSQDVNDVGRDTTTTRSSTFDYDGEAGLESFSGTHRL